MNVITTQWIVAFGIFLLSSVKNTLKTFLLGLRRASITACCPMIKKDDLFINFLCFTRFFKYFPIKSRVAFA